MIGRTLSHYRILDELGRGGIGVVYRALDTTLGREVALKVLGSASERDREQVRRLRQEARAAAALAHPAVSVVYEIDEAEGATFIAMELVRGRPLATLIAETPLEPARALDLAVEMAEGLAEAHGQGVVHRDLKPKNVMLTESGHVKIIDFGLAKLLRPRPPFESGSDTPAWSDTDPGRILGTAAYMSPEQVRGGEVDARSDLFSFGAVLYEMRRPGWPRRAWARRRRCCSTCSTAAWPRRPRTATPPPPSWWRTCARRAGGWGRERARAIARRGRSPHRPPSPPLRPACGC